MLDPLEIEPDREEYECEGVIYKSISVTEELIKRHLFRPVSDRIT